MASHVRIGAIFAQAWVLYRRRFFLLLLLGLLQAASLMLALAWRDLYYSFGFYESAPVLSGFVVQPYAGESMLAGGLVLFIFTSTAMVMLTRQQLTHGATSFWRDILGRILPALVATILCFGVIGLILYAWFKLTIEIFNGLYTQLLVIGVTLAAAMLLVAFASLIFVTLPAAALETGGPLRAIRRALALSAGQRWRFAAIILVLLLGLVLGLLVVAIPMDVLMISLPGGVTTTQYFIAAIGALLSLFFLTLTLVIASAYHQVVRLKDGVSADEVGLVFE